MRHFTYSGNLEDAIEKRKGICRKRKKIRKLRNGIGCMKSQKAISAHNKKIANIEAFIRCAEEEQEKQKGKRIMKRQAVKKLIQCAAVIAAGVLAIILFMLAIWYRGKNSEPVTDEQVAAQMQQAEPLVIETPEAATEGSIRIYDYDGCCIYSYYGKIRINSDGKDGKEIDVEALGYLEGYQEHKEESGAGE